MEDYSDWVLDENQDEDYSAWKIAPTQEEIANANIFSDPDAFHQKMENFYSASGIHGANKAFANLFGGGQHLQNANEAYERAMQTNPGATQAGELGAQLYSSIPYFMAGGMAGEALPLTGLGQSLAGLGIGGAAFGAQQQGDLLERFKNAIEGAVGGIGGGAALHGAGKLIPKAAEKIAAPFKNAFAAADDKAIADKIAHEDLGTMLGKAEKQYGSLFDKSSNKGITKSEIKQTKAPEFFSQATDEESAAVTKAFKTKKLEDIHEGYKDLGKFIADLKATRAKSGLLSPDKKALEQAQQIQSNFKDSLLEAFNKVDPELGQEFLNANKFWETEVIPNISHSKLNEYRKGRLNAEDLIDGLSRDKVFRAQLAKKYPEVKLNQQLKFVKKWLGRGALATLIGGAGGVGYDLAT